MSSSIKILVILAVLILPFSAVRAAPPHQVSGQTFTVNTTADTNDVTSQGGICADANNMCSLRAAISQANSNPDQDTIILPAGTYNLGITSPANENANASGDLDINESVIIQGAGAASTVINWAIGSTRYERVFHVDADTINTAVTFELSGVTVQGGIAGILIGQSNDTLVLSDCILYNNRGTNSGAGGVTNYGTATIDDCEITSNASANLTNGAGGGIYNNANATMTIRDSLINQNSTYDGGGIHNKGYLEIYDSIIDDNVAQGNGPTLGPGGGVYNDGTIIIDHTTISNNRALYGVGVYNSGSGTMTIRNGTFITLNDGGDSGGGVYSNGLTTIESSSVIDNRVTDRGGGVYNGSDPGVIIRNSLIAENTATAYGGGIFNSGPMWITNTTISTNHLSTTVNSFGGGIYNQDVLYLTASTITLNDAKIEGGGLYQQIDAGSTTAATTILAGNFASMRGYDCFYAPSATDRMISLGFNLLGNNNNCANFTNADDRVGIDPATLAPLLGPLQDNGGPTHTHALLEGSPAIDAVPGFACLWDADNNNSTARVPLTVDQRGSSRPYGNGCDIGAYESQEFVDLTRIPAPSLTAPANNTSTANRQPQFTWTVVPAATSYELQIDSINPPAAPAASVSGTAYTPPAPLNFGILYWRVRALGSGTQSHWTEVRTLTIIPQPPTLLLPTDGYETHFRQPQFTWQAVEGADSYQIQLGTTNPPTPNPINAATTSYTPASQLANNTTYYWRVRAVASGNTQSEWSEVRSLRIRTLPPPELVSPASGEITDGTPTFMWNAVTEATSYQLQIDTNTSFAAPLTLDQETSQLNLTPTSPLADGTYYWRVRTKSGATISAYGSARSFVVNTTCPAPTLLTPTDGASTEDRTPTFTWTSAAGGASYQIRIDINNPPTTGDIDVPSTTYTPSTNLELDKNYWRVRTKCVGGATSAWSDVFSIVITSGDDETPVLHYYTTATPVLTWNPVNDITGYHVQVAREDNFATAELVYDNAGIAAGTLQVTVSPALADGEYYWRVRSRSGSNYGKWSSVTHITVNAP